MRRILAPVLLASIARTVAVAAYLALGSTAPVRALLVASYLAIPVAIILGLVRGRSYDAAALERLVRGLRSRPGPAQLRTVMAEALEDPSLEIAYWLPQADAYAGATGSGRASGVRPTGCHDGRRRGRRAGRRPLPRPGAARPSAAARRALHHRGARAGDQPPRGGRGRRATGTITALDAERRRIERDLHDGTQQRLIALRMKLSVAERILGPDAGRAQSVLDELGGDIDSALAEVRAVSHGIAPPVLVERGLPDALTAVASSAPLHVEVHAQDLARYPPHIETAVYFCCLEALQNVEKHAGERAAADIRLREEGSVLAFVIADDGAGFDPRKVSVGSGLRNIRERVEEMGGSTGRRAARGRHGGMRGNPPARVGVPTCLRSRRQLGPECEQGANMPHTARLHKHPRGSGRISQPRT